ncbi:hypothetical protein QKU48_gp1034 [Fadolivirus algeromassiliense]|jgi:hypothetical protein|uniref:Uncharacterized protein n=1 Tax=Fadolivirus FV1/VV64 TaxID=3070911 RepID=A0A7D3V5Y0_9VIRU|nr:hypothetical protein QKU48_gp1034 [Fadolivirus algeromassiliense]QKF94492.1 hypothetical protein Fadolivirus_1_1034 [Fadolivirus FV1/VV64]
MSQPVLQWIKQTSQFNTTATDQFGFFAQQSIAVDSNGNSFIAYYTTGTVSGGTNSGSNDIVVFKLDTNGNFVWARQQATFNTNSDDSKPAITIGSSGNIYIAFQTSGTVSGGTASGGTDIAVMKMDTNGNLLWIKQDPSFNTTANDANPAISVDSNENVYVSYNTTGTVSGGTNSGSNDVVVFKLNSTGTFQWVQQQAAFNTSGSDTLSSISTDASGNVYVTYMTTGTVSGGTLSGVTDIVVFKLNTNGNFVWAQQQVAFNTTSTEESPVIVADASGNSYIAYTTDGTVSGGVNAGGSDIVLFKLDTNGNLLWVRQQSSYNSITTEAIPAIALDHTSNIYITYLFGPHAAFKIAVAKFNTDGTFKWIKNTSDINTVVNNTFPSIGLDSNCNIYVTYQTSGTVTGGSNSGSDDIVVFKLSQESTTTQFGFKYLADSYASYLGNLTSTSKYTDVLSILNAFCDLLKERITIDRKLNKANLTNNQCDIFNKSTYQQSLCKKVTYESLLSSISLIKSVLECDVDGNIVLNSVAVNILNNLFGQDGIWYNPNMSCFDDLYIYYNNKSCGTTGILWQPVLSDCLKEANEFLCL